MLELKNESKFLRFISCAAARTGQELNLSDIGTGAVICLSSQQYPLDANNIVIPIGML
ncbi:MAG TPA: hypothetical protein GX736_00140 [Mogibacterium sp.]|nr:hypothetical protein [Mogibacterium sp.]